MSQTILLFYVFEKNVYLVIYSNTRGLAELLFYCLRVLGLIFYGSAPPWGLSGLAVVM